MNCYIISYDLRNGGNYTSLHSAIKEYGTWAKITESTWAVVSRNSSAEAIRDNLLSFMDNDDRLFVIKSGGEAAWKGVITKNEWLQKHIPNN